MLRGIGEGIFGALTVEFGDRMKTRIKKSGETAPKDRSFLSKNIGKVALRMNFWTHRVFHKFYISIPS
jgi:hypothetical protein